jgi:hypothetical protein
VKATTNRRKLTTATPCTVRMGAVWWMHCMIQEVTLCCYRAAFLVA